MRSTSCGHLACLHIGQRSCAPGGDCSRRIPKGPWGLLDRRPFAARSGPLSSPVHLELTSGHASRCGSRTHPHPSPRPSSADGGPAAPPPPPPPRRLSPCAPAAALSAAAPHSGCARRGRSLCACGRGGGRARGAGESAAGAAAAARRATARRGRVSAAGAAASSCRAPAPPTVHASRRRFGAGDCCCPNQHAAAG
jgi:hypothetical protein